MTERTPADVDADSERAAVRGSSSARTQGDMDASIRSPHLRSAADAVVKRYAADPAVGVPERDARRVVESLASAIEGGPDPVVTLADVALYHRLLDALRSALVDEWRAAPPDARTVIETAAAIERVCEMLNRKGPATSIPSGVEFVAGVAHDLRSPLTSILFLAETLLSGQSGETNELQRRQLGIIYGAALGLVSVASDIIELVRGGEGLTERKASTFSVTEMLQSVHDIVRPMAEEKGLGVHLFPPADDLRLGFPLALSRVLLNLTTNGLKFTDTGFVEIAVRDMGKNRVEFSVRDTGKGYTPEAMGTLYEPFRPSRDGKKYGFSGAGLGLAISRKLVAAMNASLEVETRPSWGTRFYFELTLPVAQEV